MSKFNVEELNTKAEKLLKLFKKVQSEKLPFVHEKDSVKIYFSSKVESIGVGLSKGYGKIKASSTDDIIKGLSNKLKVFPTLESFSTIKKFNERDVILRNVIKSPSFVVSKRDTVFYRRIIEFKDTNEFYIILVNVDYPDLYSKEGTVRAKLVLAGWHFKKCDKDNYDACYMTSMDFGGYIPVLLVNNGLQDAPLSINRLNKFMNK